MIRAGIRVPRPDDLKLLRQMGYTIARTSSAMATPVRLLDDLVIIDSTRPDDERWAATRWALETALDRLLVSAEGDGQWSATVDLEVIVALADDIAVEGVERLTTEFRTARVEIEHGGMVFPGYDNRPCPWRLRQDLDDGQWVLTLNEALRDDPRRERDALAAAWKQFEDRDRDYLWSTDTDVRIRSAVGW